MYQHIHQCRKHFTIEVKISFFFFIFSSSRYKRLVIILSACVSAPRTQPFISSLQRARPPQQASRHHPIAAVYCITIFIHFVFVCMRSSHPENCRIIYAVFIYVLLQCFGDILLQYLCYFWSDSGAVCRKSVNTFVRGFCNIAHVRKIESSRLRLSWPGKLSVSRAFLAKSSECACICLCRLNCGNRR